MYKILITQGTEVIFTGAVDGLNIDFYKESIEVSFEYQGQDFTLDLNRQLKPNINIS